MLLGWLISFPGIEPVFKSEKKTLSTKCNINNNAAISNGLLAPDLKGRDKNNIVYVVGYIVSYSIFVYEATELILGYLESKYIFLLRIIIQPAIHYYKCALSFIVFILKTQSF